jgi:holin-like protein
MFTYGLGAILVCDLIGEAAARSLRLPVPGPVVGMGLLLLALIVRGGPLRPELGAAGDRLTSLLPLLFVPIGVAGFVWADVLRGCWIAVAAALVGSLLAGFAVTVGVMAVAARREARCTA